MHTENEPSSSTAKIAPAPGERNEPKGHKIHLLTTKDETGVYSAIALNLPGAGSCGDTEDEAIENAREAIRAVIETYEYGGEDIPWKDSSAEEIPFGAKQKWIIVHV